MPDDSQSLTTLLMQVREKRPGAADELIRRVYKDLRRLAAHHFRAESPGHTLQPTAVVNELYLRLFEGQPIVWQSRAHFLAIAAQQIHRILVDHARTRHACKRGGAQVRVPMIELQDSARQTDEDVIAIHEVLERLEQLDARSARVVELRFFGGLEEAETAEVLGISVTTVKRDWTFARAWLMSELAAARNT